MGIDRDFLCRELGPFSVCIQQKPVSIKKVANNYCVKILPLQALLIWSSCQETVFSRVVFSWVDKGRVVVKFDFEVWIWKKIVFIVSIQLI